ncbi:autotransporter assembly complex protein TamA [Desulfoplanes sp.]
MYKITIPLLLPLLWGVLIHACPAYAQDRTVPYTANLEGAPSDKAEQAILIAANTFSREDTPPRTPALLRRRIAEDIPTIRSILRALGYFKIRIRTAVDMQASPASVTIHIFPGPVFRMATVTLTGMPDDIDLSPQRLGLGPGTRAESSDIRKGGDKILALLGSRGYPFARIGARNVVADHAREVVDVHWTIESGPPCTFGPVTISGLERVGPSFVRRNISWQQGQPFNATETDATRMKLLKTGLFGTVRIKHAQTPLDAGALPMAITLRERVARTVKTGLEYDTDTGPGATFSWENRNVFHGGQQLRTRAKVNAIRQSADARLVFPAFFGPWQLATEGSIAREDTDAYTSRALTTGTIMEREPTQWLRTGGGVRYRLTTVDESDASQETFGLVSFPIFADAIRAKPILDPASGWTLKGETAPYLDTLGQDLFFLRSRIQGSGYLPVLPSGTLVLALRGTLGTIGGTGLQDVPADERFYAGGGGSVRGYAYQKAGDLNDDDDPVGGLSKMECSVELRAKFTKSIGGVVFLDGGRAFADAVPDAASDLFWGTGVGLSYSTPMGPIRLDVAFPLNPRPDIDASFQVYVGIGQAF